MRSFLVTALLTAASQLNAHDMCDRGGMNQFLRDIQSGITEVRVTQAHLEQKPAHIANFIVLVNELVTKIMKQHDLKLDDHEQLYLASKFDRAHRVISPDNAQVLVQQGDIAAQDTQVERENISEGMQQILATIVTMLFNPFTSLSKNVAKIVGGLVKIVGAVLADGKIDKNDLINIQIAFQNMKESLVPGFLAKTK